MKTIKRIHVYTFFILAVFLLAGSATVHSATNEDLLPEKPLMEDRFKPGFGSPVGRIQAVVGEAVVMHKDKERAYRARIGLPLYKGDILVTLAGARMQLKLNDESIITMVSNTRLTINKSVFDRAKKRFVSFLKMNIGRARFYIRKVRNMRHPEYRVKTPTAVVGVRGSDFLSEVSVIGTRITAFEETSLEVANEQFPEKFVVLNDYYQTMVKEGTLPTDPILVPLDEIEMMKKDFQMVVEEGEGKGYTVAGTEEILVPEDDLVPPEGFGPEGYEEPDVSDQRRQSGLSQVEEDMRDQQGLIEEYISEGPSAPQLPGFPGPPQP